jgi:Sec-independent protein translocase protein TatA
LGIVEIAVLLIVALIVIPPENLPEVARATGKILRELRLASNTVMRELSTIDEPTPMTSPSPPEPAKPQVSKSAESTDPT